MTAVLVSMGQAVSIDSPELDAFKQAGFDVRFGKSSPTTPVGDVSSSSRAARPSSAAASRTPRRSSPPARPAAGGPIRRRVRRGRRRGGHPPRRRDRHHARHERLGRRRPRDGPDHRPGPPDLAARSADPIRRLGRHRGVDVWQKTIGIVELGGSARASAASARLRHARPGVRAVP